MAIPETPEINPQHPSQGTATTASVRRNFAWAKAYVEQLQQALEDASIPIPAPVAPLEPPDVTSGPMPDGQVGVAYVGHTLTAAPGLILGYEAEDLPSGLDLSTNGDITGTPDTPDTHDVRFRARNAAGWGDWTVEQTVTIT